MFAAASVALCAVAWAGWSPVLADAKLCDKPQQMEGFKSCADVAKAEAEGKFVLYSTDPEQGQAKLLASFNKAFPKIKTNYVRLQAGALYAKVLSERQAKSYLVDVMQISDMGMILDFQKRGGFTQYVSPEMAAYKPEYKSTPEGFWTWGSVIMGGIAYNPKNVSEADAPKNWEDLLDPKFTDAHQGQGVELRPAARRVVHAEADPGQGLLQEIRAAEAPRLRLLRPAIRPPGQRPGQGHHGRAVFGLYRVQGQGRAARLRLPRDGVPAVSETCGIVADGPHPNAAQLFMDWFLSPVGQQALAEVLLLHSPREDVPPPPGGVPLKEFKLLIPTDWNAFEKDRAEFAKEWDRIAGALR